VLTIVYATLGLSAMWLAPRVPYADAWRFLAHFLTTAFPFDILAPDNGHHETLPNVIRVIDLRLFAANQSLQVYAGIVLALATLVVMWRGLRALPNANARIASMLAATLGIFWLGNVRALAHANESVHAYGVTLFLVLGLQALMRDDPQGRRVGSTAVAALCGLAAAFSFGSGSACFVAFMAVLLVRRAGWRQWLVLATGLLVTLALLHWSGGSGVPLRLAPRLQAEGFLRWLAGPCVYAAWPALDPALAAQVPLRFVRAPVVTAATAYQATFGPVMLARWPHVLLGAAGLAVLAMQTLRAWRKPAACALFGVGIAWFAAAVGLMVALVRVDYFQAHPEQLLAARYVVWSSLFWTGLALTGIAQARHAQRALATTVLAALLLLPSQAWMGELGARMVHVANRTAVAAAVGVVEPTMPLGETDPSDLASALPSLRTAHAAMFAWPDTAWLGRKPPADAMSQVTASAVQVVDVDNRFGARGRRVEFTLEDARGPRVLLIDRDGVVRGLALRDGVRGHWLGWMQGVASEPGPPQVALVR
jgi:hypothetical protein